MLLGFLVILAKRIETLHQLGPAACKAAIARRRGRHHVGEPTTHFFQLARPAVVFNRPFQTIVSSLGSRFAKTLSSSSWMSAWASSSLSRAKAALLGLLVGEAGAEGVGVGRGAFFGLTVERVPTSAPAFGVACVSMHSQLRSYPNRHIARVRTDISGCGRVLASSTPSLSLSDDSMTLRRAPDTFRVVAGLGSPNSLDGRIDASGFRGVACSSRVLFGDGTLHGTSFTLLSVELCALGAPATHHVKTPFSPSYSLSLESSTRSARTGPDLSTIGTASGGSSSLSE